MTHRSRVDASPQDAERALKIVGEYQRRPLDSIDRAAEIIYGLIMVLTFTSALSVARSGRQEVRDMLLAALGCNVAWGIIDGVMYVLTSVVTRARRALVIRGIRSADDETSGAIVMGALPEGVALATSPADVKTMVAHFRALPEESFRARVTRDDLTGALGACLLVFVATLPPTLPYLFFEEAIRAQRVSNAVAVGCLFLAGYTLGEKTGVRGWLLGLSLVLIGAALVVVCILLGG